VSVSIFNRLNKLQQIWQLRRSLQLVWHSAPGWAIANIVLAIVQGGLPLLSLYLTKLLVDSIPQSASALHGQINFQSVLLLVIGIGGITLFATLCASLTQFVSTSQGQVVTDYVREMLHAKSVEVDLEYYENSSYYDALHLAQQEAPYRPPQLLDALVKTGQSGISLFAIATLLISLHWGIAVVLLISALPLLGVRLKYINRLYRKQQEWTPQERQADYYTWLLTTLTYAKEVRLFNLGELFQRRFRLLRNGIRRDKLSLARRSLLAEWAVQGSMTAIVVGVSVYIAFQAYTGAITVGGLVMYYQAFQRGQATLSDVFGGLSSLYENSLFLGHLYEFLELKRAVDEPIHPKPFPMPIRTGIRFENVQFQYPGSERSLLQDVSLTIQPGETIALVGENGAGKTTLIKLLCRLYDPSHGKITVDGIDFREFATAELRQQISVVFQDYAHYDLTVQENIGVGNLSQFDNQVQIEHAAKLSGADRVINRLPKGYNTQLGKAFADGEELSIGEWQKIALARSFLRDSQLVILDEPTSALDARSEYEVFEQFRQLIQGRTAILISHRLSTIKLADRIYFLKHGQIVESGTHTELMNLGGAYANLFTLQASSYLEEETGQSRRVC
jgi:ATP-binding cassette, subfamily B, bacterial